MGYSDLTEHQRAALDRLEERRRRRKMEWRKQQQLMKYYNNEEEENEAYQAKAAICSIL